MDKTEIPYWEGLRNQIRYRADHPRNDAVVCSSGEVTHSYLDLKSHFTHRGALRQLGEAMRIYRRLLGVKYPTAVGGPTMGADFMAFSVVMFDDLEWFSVRDTPKDHGLQKMIEGAELDDSDRVILVDDVVSTGASLMRAFDTVWDSGAEIVAVMPLVDRAGVAETSFLERGVRYHPLFTHHELGIDPL